jgi:RNA recognition motif-containing protein
MAKKLYVGNLAYGSTEEQLRTLFSQAGEVKDVAIITDRETNRSRGFGFVEMVTDEGAKEAIKRFNGYSLDNRQLTVNEARPREERAGGGGGGGGMRGGGGGGDRRGGDDRGGRNGDRNGGTGFRRTRF